MRIERAVLRELPLLMRAPFRVGDEAVRARRVLLLTLHAEGLEGWSECVAMERPSYTYETTDTAWQILTELVLPAVVGRAITAPGDVLAPVRWIRGHEMALAAVEMAAWDLAARAEGVPLSRALGGSAEAVAVGVSVGLQPSDEALLDVVCAFVEEGYARVKIKIEPGRDIEPLARVRERFPDLALTADANSAYALDDAAHLRRLDALRLVMIEQPLGHRDFLHHARLRARIGTPICLDESIRSVGDAELALELGSCDVLNIKPGRVGGHASARSIHDLARARGLPVWCGGMLESGVGRAHNLALASLPGFSLPGDISASRRYWERDIVWPEFALAEDGRMRVPTGAGIGVDIDRERIARTQVREAAYGG